MTTHSESEITLGKWTLKKKLILLMVMSGLLPFLFFFFISLNASKKEMLELNKNRLVSIREAKKLQIEEYFKQIASQVITMSNSFMVVDAMDKFTMAFHNVGNQMAGQTINESKLRERYSYQQKNTPGANSDAIDRWLPSGENSKILQSLYISENPQPIGEKHNLDAAPQTIGYNGIHEQYHPAIRQFLNEFGYYDIFLVDAETGYIVYSVFKEVDYATSLMTGPYKDSGIGRAFNAALKLDDPNSFVLEDFETYEPSYNAAASFIASPIVDMGEKIGVLIFQAPVDVINSVMTSNNRWKEVGLGDSGEVYMVGPDHKLRNNSRFIIEAPQ
jgi:methyl-accepting chemotaxis protein